MRFLGWWVADIAGLAVAAWFFDNIWLEGAGWQEKLVPLLIGAAILALIHTYVAPVVKLLAIPFIVVTLGLFLLVVNAGMLLFAGWISEQFDIGFGVEGFWTAVGGAIVLSIVGAFTSAFVLERD